MTKTWLISLNFKRKFFAFIFYLILFTYETIIDLSIRFYNENAFILSASSIETKVPYFIEYNAHTSIVRTWILQWFLAKKLFLFFKNNFTKIDHKSHLKPFLSYLPCIACREYFSIIFNLKKCALYSIKYGKCWLFN